MKQHKPPVINRHHFKDGLPPGAVYVGRGTPLGNPFRSDEPNALGRYAGHLHAAIVRQDAGVMKMLSAIDETTPLACSCAPRPCHADVIANAWAWLMDGRPDPNDWAPRDTQTVLT